jgi:predicted RNA-binding Zn ribbon-like protein
MSGMAAQPRTMAGLDLVGGNLGLDFANSVNSRATLEHDYLGTVGDLIDWAALAGVIADGERSALAERVAADPGSAHRLLRDARRLREAIYRTFSAIAEGSVVPDREARRLLRAYGTAVARASMAGRSHGAAMHWDIRRSPRAVLDPIAYAAGALLLAGDRPPIKECPGCGWLLLDRTRNRRRRWCDMRTCGSRDKMRRYYQSRRAGLRDR